MKMMIKFLLKELKVNLKQIIKTKKEKILMTLLRLKKKKELRQNINRTKKQKNKLIERV